MNLSRRGLFGAAAGMALLLLPSKEKPKAAPLCYCNYVAYPHSLAHSGYYMQNCGFPIFPSRLGLVPFTSSNF